MKTRKIGIWIVAMSLIAGAVIVGIDLFHGMDRLHIGLLRGQEDFFLQTDKIATSTGKTVCLHFYETFREMEKDIHSGALDIYVAPLFEHIVNPRESLAVAAIKADYILAGKERKSPTPIGVTEYHISRLLIGNAKALKETKYTSLPIEEEEKCSFLEEEIIDFAIFRNEVPERLINQGFSPIISLSELGFKNDVLCVRRELLLHYDALVQAIFLSCSPEGHMLPSEAEVKNAVQYLFKSGAIKERKRYTDLVHIR